jgi:low affinity Fe/Cu permease
LFLKEHPMPSGKSRRKSGAGAEKRQPPLPRQDWFSAFAQKIARLSGKPAAFLGAVALIAVWAISGPFLGFSETWQLVINTGTTIVTFLMVFLIQSTQNRDAEAMQVKLDEIIRAIGNARNEVLDLEELEGEDLDRIRASYEELARKARTKRDGTR